MKSGAPLLGFAKFYLAYREQLTITPRARVGYEMIDEARSAELAIIISYPTSVSGKIVFLITPPRY